MDILGFGGWEIFIIIVVAFLIFGPGKIVEFARSLGKFVYSVRNATTTITNQITKELEPPAKPKEPPTEAAKKS